MIKQTFFLGGTSPTGFRSGFSELINSDDYYTIILKGGPGTGKSTLMKKIAEVFDDCNVYLFYCSSDIKSLDAVVIEDKKLIVVDGTSPHTFDPVYPGAKQEIVNLGEYWDSKSLRDNIDGIVKATDENKLLHARVKAYIRAVSSINDDIVAIGENALFKEKLKAYASRLCRKAIPRNKGAEGSLRFCQLSAFTTENYKTMELSGDYSVYILNDDYFCGSDSFLRLAADFLVSNGHDAIVSECTMHHIPMYEHIISESAKVAFLSSNFFNKCDYRPSAHIHFRRFYDKEKLSAKKQRYLFDKKASLQLAHEASEILAEALEVHDELEKFYISSIDYEKLGKFTARLIKRIKAIQS